jgi:tRNA1Val (adenine37-N6)-methyltransferase
MPNPYFQFKQFTIHQDRCAMKVCTDACILGAWFAEKIPPHSLVLDIGSGTGLLMLQLAQQHKGEIHGIELDPDAYRQGKENIALTKWNDRLNTFSGDARSFAFPKKYDVIVTNPPFFEGDLTASTDPKNLARHSKELTLAELMVVIDANLSPSGSFGILLPYHRSVHFHDLASTYHFSLRAKLSVRQTPGHGFFRTIFHFSRNEEGSLAKEGPVAETTLTIKNDQGHYTEEFIALLKDYYLYL